MERVLVIDFGGQYTHLIARRCRELGVYAEILPQDRLLGPDDIHNVKGVILSGGPRTVTDEELHGAFSKNITLLLNNGIHTLGICFGHQLLARYKGAHLEAGGNPEYGMTNLRIINPKYILKGLSKTENVWMSHSDQVKGLPNDLIPLAESRDGHIAAFASTNGLIFGVQFHPEVSHTPRGMHILENFLRNICGYKEQWTPESQVESILKYVRDTVGDGLVLMGTSGGVDSTVAAYLIRQAIGDRIFCVFVDNGLLRHKEREEVEDAFQEMGFQNFVTVDAGDLFLSRLENIVDPEEKRKIIAETFIEVFEQKAKELEAEYGKFEYLGQGTIYPDRVESAATGKATAVIKSHHNVRLPDWMHLKVVEPLRDLYKDEVRQVGRSLGIPKRLLERQPFPGPSLAIRIGGPVTRQQLEILRKADAILQETLIEDPVYSTIWQSFCVLLPIRTVGVMGDERTYDQVVVIRAVESRDAMTASVSRFDWDVLLKAASRIANEVAGVNRVVYDLTSKPPATIEWY